MSKPWILVSPSSRGIGHALTRHLLRTTTLPILATARSDLGQVKNSILDGFGSDQAANDASARLHLVKLDVTDESTIKAARAKAETLFSPREYHLHLGFALPGILHPERSTFQVEYDDALETLKVNLLGPLMLMKWFSDFLPRKSVDLSHVAAGTQQGSGEGAPAALKIPEHAVWLSTSARVGSTADNRLGGWYSYRASKSGVNSITRTFDLQLQTRSKAKAIAVAYHPGTVKTGLSKEFWGNVQDDRLFSPEFAAEKMVEVVMGSKVEDRGRCWDWKGQEILP
ncbi:short-chain dehydrogenase/reductase-like protein [Biscogniauxia marginata]|nr:short-chain dehydrogenase/reductase-like protein [Biscogniauxia marginata]